jgi:hypothetical protein
MSDRRWDAVDDPSFELQMAKAREGLAKPDPLSLWTTVLAENLTTRVRQQFPDHHDQEVCARLLMLLGGDLGGLVMKGSEQGHDPSLAILCLNVSAGAAVNLVDRIAMDQAEQ